MRAIWLLGLIWLAQWKSFRSEISISAPAASDADVSSVGVVCLYSVIKICITHIDLMRVNINLIRIKVCQRPIPILRTISIFKLFKIINRTLKRVSHSFLHGWFLLVLYATRGCWIVIRNIRDCSLVYRDWSTVENVICVALVNAWYLVHRA